MPTIDSGGPSVDQPEHPFRGKSVDDELAKIVYRYQDPKGHTISPLPITSAWLIDARDKGPRISLFGGVHGDEISGLVVVARLLDDLASERIVLAKGSLQVVIANEVATTNDTRFTDLNMNRLFGKENRERLLKERPETRESAARTLQRVESLEGVMAKADIHLDLHSTRSPSEPFLVASPRSRALAEQLGVAKIVTFSPQVSPCTTDGISSHFFEALRDHKLGITYESGQHFATDGPERAYQVTLRMLEYYGVIEQATAPRSLLNLHTTPTVYEIVHIERKVKEGFQYTKDQVGSFQVYQGDDIIGGYPDQLITVRDRTGLSEAVLMLPAPPDERSIGDELFYLAKQQ